MAAVRPWVSGSPNAAPAVATLAVAWIAGCGIRIYFAMLAESQIPRELTGSAAGVVSLIGAALVGWVTLVFTGVGGVAGFLIGAAAGVAAGKGASR